VIKLKETDLKEGVEITEDDVVCTNCFHVGDRRTFGKEQNTCPICKKTGCNQWANEGIK
jgi:hypothetical protein